MNRLSTPRLSDAICRRAFWALLLSLTAYRLVIAGLLGLSTDESHYALYARHPDWGYFDHPPLVAFLGALTTVGGRTHPFFFRLGPILCALLTAVVLRKLAMELTNSERRAFWAVVWFTLLPVHFLLAGALLPDATLHLFWCAALLAAWRAFRDNRWGNWLLAGAFAGGALLSKYHGALLPVCLFGYAVTSRETRRRLLQPHPYAAGLVAFLLFLPNIVWNYRHHWASYAYQFRHGTGSGRFTADKLFELLGGQMVAASPIILVLFFAACWLARREHPLAPGLRFALWTSLPVFGLFGAMGLFGKILPHWTAVGWCTGVMVLAEIQDRKVTDTGPSARRWARWLTAGGVVALLMVLLLQVAMTFPIVEPLYQALRTCSLRLNAYVPWCPVLPPYRSKFDLTNDLYGWDQAAAEVQRIRLSMPQPHKTFVFAHRFYTTSQIGVYLPRDTRLASFSRKPGQYQFWFQPREHEGWDALFINDDRWPKDPNLYRERFARIDPHPLRLTLTRRGTVAHVLDVYRCYGFRGCLDTAP